MKFGKTFEEFITKYWKLYYMNVEKERRKKFKFFSATSEM